MSPDEQLHSDIDDIVKGALRRLIDGTSDDRPGGVIVEWSAVEAIARKVLDHMALRIVVSRVTDDRLELAIEPSSDTIFGDPLEIGKIGLAALLGRDIEARKAVQDEPDEGDGDWLSLYRPAILAATNATS